jgi:hypothetical protein
MAKQKGILPIEGTIGNLTFFKSQDGYMVRSRGGVPADKIANDPAFQRTRENMAEFGRAGKASKLLRNAYRAAITKAKDRLVVSRLTTDMLKVVQADETNNRGQRNVIDGEASLLEGFDFNIQAKLSATFYAPYTAELDRVTGNGVINIPAFAPLSLVAAPAGTTHFQLFMGAAAIDFEAGTYDIDTMVSGNLEYSNVDTAVITLTATLPANSKDPMFLAFGVEFMQQVNGKMYGLNNGAFNACSIIRVNTPV